MKTRTIGKKSTRNHKVSWVLVFNVFVDHSTCGHQLSKEMSSNGLFMGNLASRGNQDVLIRPTQYPQTIRSDVRRSAYPPHAFYTMTLPLSLSFLSSKRSFDSSKCVDKPPWWEMQIDFRCKRAGNRRANMIINSYGNLLLAPLLGKVISLMKFFTFSFLIFFSLATAMA